MIDDRKKLSKAPPLSLKDGGEGEADSSIQQEAKSLQEVFKVLVKAIKNLKIYLPNNPVHQRFLKEFHTKLHAHLTDYGDSVLTVGQYTLTYHDQIIYENINRLDSLSFKLFVDGVRQVTLLEGISEEESGNLLDVLGNSYDSERPDDDLVTLLWQKRFHHVKFQILEDYFNDAVIDNREPEASTKAGFTQMIQSELKSQEELQENQNNLTKGKSLTDEQATRNHFHQVFRLTEDEINTIKEEMKAEMEKDLISEMVDIIYSVLQVEKDDRFFSEMIELLITNTAHFIEEGDFIQVEKIIRLFVFLKEQIPPIPESQVEVLNQILNSLGKPDYLNNIERHINTLDDKNLMALSGFLRMLNSSAAFSIIDILSKAKVRKTRKILSDVLVEFGKKDITPILNRLQGSQWFVIRNLVQIIGQIGNQQAIDSLRKLVQYPDERVRKEIVYTLMIIGKENEKAKEMILTFLNDNDTGIRKQVIQIIQQNKYERAFPMLMKRIAEEDFVSREQEEKYLVFGALGKLGNRDLIPMLKDYLKPTFFTWIKRKHKEDRAVCALYALRQMEFPEAVALLTEAKKNPYQTVSDFASRTLFEIQRAKEKKELKRKNEFQDSDTTG